MLLQESMKDVVIEELGNPFMGVDAGPVILLQPYASEQYSRLLAVPALPLGRSAPAALWAPQCCGVVFNSCCLSPKWQLGCT